MCLIVDTCCIPLVFNVKSMGHARFAPIYAWIDGKHGRIIFGGTKYAKELKLMNNFMRLFAEYEKQGKVVRVNDSEVDRFAAEAKAKVKSKAFDDEHLVGIVAASNCRIICTDDRTAIPFLTRKDLYEAPTKPPKIYSKKMHGHLCSKKSIVSICRN